MFEDNFASVQQLQSRRKSPFFTYIILTHDDRQINEIKDPINLMKGCYETFTTYVSQKNANITSKNRLFVHSIHILGYLKHSTVQRFSFK
jgi:hypothetical protein